MQKLVQHYEVGAPLTVQAFQGKEDVFTPFLCAPLLELPQD